MRYIIYGAGAIGGTIGARLFLAGHEVVLIARGAHRDAIAARGLRFRAPDGEWQLPIAVVGSPAEITFTPGDAVFLCMKTQHTEEALLALDLAGGGVAAVVAVQNGVENERLIARRFERAYAMLVALPATHLVPGEVLGEGTPLSGCLPAGRYPSGVDSTIEQICADLDGAHFRSWADPEILSLKYAKLLLNLANGVEAITGRDAWNARDAAARFVAALRAEAEGVYTAAGLSWTPAAEYQQRVRSHYGVGTIAGAPRGGSSTLQSIQRGHTSTEVDYLNGEIVLLGRLHGVPTPLNATVRRLATEAAARRLAPGSVEIADLWRLAGVTPVEE